MPFLVNPTQVQDLLDHPVYVLENQNLRAGPPRTSLSLSPSPFFLTRKVFLTRVCKQRVSQRFVQFFSEEMPIVPLSRCELDLPLVGHVDAGLPDHQLPPLGVELGLQLALLRRRRPQRGLARLLAAAFETDDNYLLNKNINYINI